MNILVTGAKGQLGSWIGNLAASSSDRYILTDVGELDICSLEQIREMLSKEKVDVIVNCAAYTDVERAEANPDLAGRLNAEAVGLLAGAARESGALLVHISTDYVFGGELYNTPCREDMKGTPTGVYGLTKLRGEQAVLDSGCRYILIRTAWLYSEYGRNFVKTIMKLSSERPQLKVVFDQVGTPTYARDLARAIVDIISARSFEGHCGIYHFTDEGVCSWYDFAKAIARISGHDACDILPCHSDEFPSKVKRPAYSVLDKTLIKQTFGVTVPYWTDSLAECIANIQNSKFQ